MNHVEGTFKGIRDTTFFYEGWLPKGKPKAVLLIVHGLGEHVGRYLPMADFFTPHGYSLYGLDHIGHGKSGGEPEVVERFSVYTSTLETFSAMVRGWQPGRPVFLYGHSMGGLIAVDYLLDHQEEFKGAIISAPAIKVPASITATTIALARVMSVIAPRMGVSALDATGISRDPEVVKAYVNDPLVFHGKTPARLAAELLSTMQMVNPQLDRIRLPLLAVQGEADTMVDPGGARLLHERAGSSDKTLKVYPGLFHEVHNEPERLQVLKDVQAWLSSHL